MTTPTPKRPKPGASHKTPGPLDRNSTLSRLTLTSDEVRAGLAILMKVAPRPQDAVGVGLAAAGAAQAVAAALLFLQSPVESAVHISNQLSAFSECLKREMEATGTKELVRPRERRLTNFPAWGMCIALGIWQAGIASLIVAGLYILWANHCERPVPIAKAKMLVQHGLHCDLSPEELRTLLDSDIDLADSEWPWLAPLQRQWAAMRNAFEADGGPPPTSPSFQARARGQLFARAHYASPAHRAGVPTHRELSTDQYAEACRQVAAWIEADDWRGGYAYLTATSGLTVDLAPRMPLASGLEENWMAVADPVTGTQRVDLSFLAPEAAAAPSMGSFVAADFILEKPMPSHLKRNLVARMTRYPDAKAYRDLYPEAPLDLAGHMDLLQSNGGIAISWARWGNSSGTYMRQSGMDDFLACIQSCDFGHAARSKLYYAVVSRSEIWSAAKSYFDQAGFGAPVPDTGGKVAFGCRVVATAEGLLRAVGWHRASVAAARPARRDRSIGKLIEFHNRYTRLVAFELAMLLALREDRQYEIWADIDEESDAWVEILDKAVPGPVGAQPTPLCGRARAAIGAYRIHCRSVAKRMASLGDGDSELYKWLTAIGLRERVCLLCMASGPDDPRPAGSADAFGILPKPLTLAADAGRKWLENALRQRGLRTRDIDGMLRHEVIGQSRSSSASDFILIEWATRVGAAVDATAKGIFSEPVSGLAKR